MPGKKQHGSGAASAISFRWPSSATLLRPPTIMPTHPCGHGTVNIAINVDRAERQILGMIAAENDESIGRLLRGLWLRALRSDAPDVAQRISAIRRNHRRAVLDQHICTP